MPSLIRPFPRNRRNRSSRVYAGGLSNFPSESDLGHICERSNVVVVQPSPAARRGGARPVYLGEILDDDLVAAVAGWVDAGGPGAAPIPPILAGRSFPRPSILAAAEEAAAAAAALPAAAAAEAAAARATASAP